MSAARVRFNQLLEDVVAGVNDIAAAVDRPAADEFAATAIVILALAISKLSAAAREDFLLGVEDGSKRNRINNRHSQRAPHRRSSPTFRLICRRD
jgi:hypothetical protein